MKNLVQKCLNYLAYLIANKIAFAIAQIKDGN